MKRYKLTDYGPVEAENGEWCRFDEVPQCKPMIPIGRCQHDLLLPNTTMGWGPYVLPAISITAMIGLDAIDTAINRIEECELSMDDSERLVLMLRDYRRLRERLPEADKAIVSMAQDGWLMHGPEGMCPIQTLVWEYIDKYKLVQP